METTHRVTVGDARELSLADESVELVVTSPPYPMIDLWDDLFRGLDPAIADALEAGDGDAAFEAMHAILDDVWDEIDRVLAPGGIVCVNVGDATRTVDERFRIYPNHVRVTTAFEDRGFDSLPDIVWQKPANSSAKFMGSGMIPPNAYVTLEHEHILVFRKGSRRSFEPGSDKRYESAFFWEERNRWFTDVWTEVRGRFQELEGDGLRDRSAAYPFEIPYRLINMYSVYGDTVLDPFWGTGTTTLAAMVAGRHSVGVELDSEFTAHFERAIDEVPEMSREVVQQRLDDHWEFVEQRRDAGGDLKYDATNLDVPVVTKQERDIRLYVAESVEGAAGGAYSVVHTPADERLPAAGFGE